MTDVVKKSGIRETAEGVNVGSDFYQAVDNMVKDLVGMAVERAKQNGRRTVKARDI